MSVHASVCLCRHFFFVCLQGKFLVVMSSSGVIYSQPIIPSLNADEGPCYLTIDLSINHAAVEVHTYTYRIYMYVYIV